MGRSQVRRILLAEGARWRQPRSWTTSTDPDFVPKSHGHRLLYHPARRNGRDLRRRARPGDPPQLPTGTRLDPDGHRVKAPLDDGRRSEQDLGLRRPARRRRAGGDDDRILPQLGRLPAPADAVEAANPDGAIVVVTDNLSSHTSASTRTWLADHPRIRQVFIPKRACWRNLQEGCWRLSRRQALAGQSFATLPRSPWPPGSRPASSTPAPARGCGAGHHRPHATDAAPSPTGSELAF